MGVSKYIEEISSKIEERIQKNLESIEAAPYPKEELDTVKTSAPESAIAKAYGEGGRIDGIPSELFQQAASQDPNLFKRLEAGSKSLRKARQNEMLGKIDPNSLLSSRYFAFVNGLAASSSLGSKLTLDETLKSNPDEFYETYELLLDEARNGGGLNEYGVPDADVSTVMSAFAELKGKEKTVASPTGGSPINESAVKVAVEEKAESTVNLPGATGVSPTTTERVSSAVLGTEVKIPEEIAPPMEPISINIENEPTKKEEAAAVQTVTEIKETVTTPLTTEGAKTVNTINEGSTSIVSETKSSPTEINQTSTVNALSEPSSPAAGESTKTSSDSFIERYIGPLTPEYREGLKKILSSSSTLTSKTSDSKEKSSQAINSTEKTSSQSTRESAETSSSASDSMVNLFEKSSSSLSSSNIGEYLKYIESRVNTDRLTSTQKETSESRSESTIDRSSEKMNVTRESPSFPEKIAPAPPLVKPESTKSGGGTAASSGEIPTIKMEQVPSEPTAVSPSTAQPSAAPTAASQSTQIIGLDELTRRMARIEHLLSNPLEVKLVD